ncbi:hypothetical protein GCM10010170_054190 [Dactylosporangium salmoneum]|uniref:Uncharacterized protein n=1 Tax=Dactylosporangium salmoneum TaxID=53361 RepID=A0ABP5TRD6_9ACTN
MTTPRLTASTRPAAIRSDNQPPTGRMSTARITKPAILGGTNRPSDGGERAAAAGNPRYRPEETVLRAASRTASGAGGGVGAGPRRAR